MDYYLFIDESGNHGLSEENTDFPVFVLCGFLMEANDYVLLKDDVSAIKSRFWGDKEIIFHSRDIRKQEKGFKILQNNEIKCEFVETINKLLIKTKFTVISCAINKPSYIKKYGKLSKDVYELCLSLIIERTIFYLDNIKENINLHIVIEARGKKENEKLKTHFQRLKAHGTGYVNAERLKKYSTIIAFREKKQNIIGLQMSDLIAYPIARYVIDNTKPNPAYEIIKEKLYKSGDKIYGLKIHP